MSEDSDKAILLRNARIITPVQVIEEGNILIESGYLGRVLDSAATTQPRADSAIDLAGLTLFPGFIDAHIHGAAGVDTMDAGVDDLRHVAEFLARNGVTAWIPTLVPASQTQYQNAIRNIEKSISNQKEAQTRFPGSRVLGVHYEGPFVNGEQCGALHHEHFRSYKSTADLDALPTIQAKTAIHLMTLAPEIEGGIDLTRELTERGWIVSIGHTRATVDVLDQAFRAGTHHMTHFMNAMTPLHHRAPGPVGWGLSHDEVTCDVIADGIHIDALILQLIARSKGPERLSLISDAIAAAGLGDGKYQIWGEEIVVKDGRTQNARGNIAGSIITMLDAVRLMLSLGASEVEVARMAALNPARLLRVDKDCGSIEEGKRADLVAVDENLNVRVTLIGGRIAFQGPE